jgi:hypothetical protein
VVRAARPLPAGLRPVPGRRPRRHDRTAPHPPRRRALGRPLWRRSARRAPPRPLDRPCSSRPLHAVRSAPGVRPPAGAGRRAGPGVRHGGRGRSPHHHLAGNPGMRGRGRAALLPGPSGSPQLVLPGRRPGRQPAPHAARPSWPLWWPALPRWTSPGTPSSRLPRVTPSVRGARTFASPTWWPGASLPSYPGVPGGVGGARR